MISGCLLYSMQQQYKWLVTPSLSICPQTSDLSVVFTESSPSTPLIFVLSPGTDPAADLYKFADVMQFSKKMNAISLGQGQVRTRGVPGNSLSLSLSYTLCDPWERHCKTFSHRTRPFSFVLLRMATSVLIVFSIYGHRPGQCAILL